MAEQHDDHQDEDDRGGQFRAKLRQVPCRNKRCAGEQARSGVAKVKMERTSAPLRVSATTGPASRRMARVASIEFRSPELMMVQQHRELSEVAPAYTPCESRSVLGSSRAGWKVHAVMRAWPHAGAYRERDCTRNRAGQTNQLCKVCDAGRVWSLLRPREGQKIFFGSEPS